MRRGLLARARPYLVAVAAVTAVGGLGGCSVLDMPRVPRPCDIVYTDARCLAIRDAAAMQLGVMREDVTSVEILPDPTPQVVNGQKILVMGGPSLRVHVSLADGASQDLMMCVGVAMQPACQADPVLRVSTPTANGYRDTPEGSTPVPGPAADALAAATDLTIVRRDIPVDGVGLHEIRLGEALLPNGLLTTADFELVDDWPSGLSLRDGLVSLEVRSVETGEPLWNVFVHGWREGTERVEVFLVFDVFHVDPGAVLSIRDVVVR